jgi:osmoprotectant transport system ATP-binding protein
MIQIQNVTFRYQSADVLNGINLNLEPEQFHVILGPSGCGKTTLLKVVAGLIKPTSGSINGVNEYGYMLQEAGLFPHLSAAENIAIQGMQQKWNQRKIQDRLEQLAKLTNFPSPLMQKKPNQISGGQRQRVALMRALFMNADLILMDEPFSALDPLLKYEILSEMKPLFQKLKKTVLLVTHDLIEASFLASTITLMKNGNIEEHNSKKLFFENPKTDFAKKFIESQKLQS